MLLLRSQRTAPSEFFGEDALPSMTIRNAFSDDITTVKVENGHPKKFVQNSGFSVIAFIGKISRGK